MIVDAWWLPGLEAAAVPDWQTRELDGITLRWPVLRPDTLRAVLAAIGSARQRGAAMLPIRARVAAIDAAAARLADARGPFRALAEAALPAVTGYAPEMVRLALERMIPDWRAPALERLLRAELGDPAVLDGFAPDLSAGARRLVHATGPDLALHVFAGNVPGVAVTSLVRSLLAGSATLGKTAAGEPVLAALFARALAGAAPELAARLAVTYWPGGTTELEDVALEAADTVVVYGGAETLRALRARTPPATRLLDHGPRYSLGIVCRDALTGAAAPATATAIARAVAIFDQQGCVSPHAVYVERGGEVEPPALAGLVAGALAGLEQELPRGRLDAAEAAAVHQARAAAEFRAIAGADVRLHPGERTTFTVAYDADPAFAVSCLNRFIWIKPLDDALEVVPLLRAQRAVLQTVAVAGGTDRLPALARALATIGVCRVTGFEDAPWPPPDWHHDGRGPLRELLRWTDLELPAPPAAR